MGWPSSFGRVPASSFGFGSLPGCEIIPLGFEASYFGSCQATSGARCREITPCSGNFIGRRRGYGHFSALYRLLGALGMWQPCWPQAQDTGQPGWPDVAICRQTGDFQTCRRPIWRLESFGDLSGDFGDIFGD